MKLGHWCKNHNWGAALRIYANLTACPLYMIYSLYNGIPISQVLTIIRRLCPNKFLKCFQPEVPAWGNFCDCETLSKVRCEL